MINKACRNKKELATHDVGFLYFPPFNGDDQEFVPILNFKADFSGEIPQIFFRVAMLRYDLDSGKLRIFGLRFETPHPKSNHDYCHVQFTRDPLDMATSNASESIEMIAAWSPQHVPCILAPAQGPASLLVWLIVGLYGKNVGSLFSARNFPKDYTEPLRYLKKFDAQ
ncbi:MAG: hypothetical protein CW716_07335 [Candidatus Bathyarchaeum sp.]|nr:MAG: hypothetical protein CW716_07335 [Candidatus Bathyarchaeum sp.]